MVVIWTETASLSYERTLVSIAEKWGYKSVFNFQKEVKRILIQLQSHPELFPKSNLKENRKCVLSSQTSLIYKLQKNKIELVTFIDNRS